jgi:hypothetical protein
VQQTFDTVNSQVVAVSGQVSSSVDTTTQQVLGALPPPVKDALVAVGGAAAAVGGQVVLHPKEAAVVALAVGVPTAYRCALMGVVRRHGLIQQGWHRSSGQEPLARDQC